jgi:hypothetical protein
MLLNDPTRTSLGVLRASRKRNSTIVSPINCETVGVSPHSWEVFRPLTVWACSVLLIFVVPSRPGGLGQKVSNRRGRSRIPGTATAQSKSYAAIGFNTPSSGADPDANEVLARRPLARQLPGPGRPRRRARPPPRWVGNSRTHRDVPRGRNPPRPEHRNSRGRVMRQMPQSKAFLCSSAGCPRNGVVQSP